MSELTHFNQAGEAHMVDIADKDQTHRIGIAEGWISMHPETFALVEKGNAKKGDVLDTTGAGDAFFAGTVIGQTYGKTLAESCEIGSRLAASVICITENVCPRFRPLEFGLDVPVVD